MDVSLAPASPAAASPGRGWVLAALWATPPLLVLGYLHLAGAAMMTANGDPEFTAAVDRIMPWMFWAGLGSIAMFVVLCAMLPDLPDGRHLVRRWLAWTQIGLLLLPTVLVQSLPSP